MCAIYCLLVCFFFFFKKKRTLEKKQRGRCCRIRGTVGCVHGCVPPPHKKPQNQRRDRERLRETSTAWWCCIPTPLFFFSFPLNDYYWRERSLWEILREFDWNRQIPVVFFTPTASPGQSFSFSAEKEKKKKKTQRTKEKKNPHKNQSIKCHYRFIKPDVERLLTVTSSESIKRALLFSLVLWKSKYIFII